MQDGSFKYVKFHVKTTIGVKNLTREEATKLAGENPDHLVQDMYEAIERGDHPVWNVFVQVMDPKQAENYKWNIFDMTKVWPHTDFPLRQIGRLTLNRNVGGTGICEYEILTPSIAQELFRGHRASEFLSVNHGSRNSSLGGSQ